MHHCQLQFIVAQSAIWWNKPLELLQDIMSSLLNFQDFLWRSLILVTEACITEEYQWIRRQVRPCLADKAVLQPAY
jgi:hypothetical protein